MCIGVPMRVLAVSGEAARCADAQGRETAAIDLSLIDDVTPGTWLLTFLGAAREVIDDERARQVNAALDGVRAAMAGDALDAAFADITEREPSLPPHLEAARAAGAREG